MSRLRSAVGLLALTGCIFSMMNIQPMQAEDAKLVVPSIEITRSDAGLVVVGKVSAFGSANFETSLTVTRIGTSGSMNTNQGGRWTLAPGETKTAGHIAVSFSEGDHLKAELVVTSGGQVLASTALNVGG